MEDDMSGKKKSDQNNPHSGSIFDGFLDEKHIRGEIEAVAIKRVIAWQLAETMKAQNISKKAMATLMRTSRSQLDRLLNPENASVNLETITRAARIVGKELRIEMIDTV